MATVWAVLAHGSGGHAAQDVEVSGETRQEIYQAACAKAIGSRYVAQIVAHDGTTLYTEDGGWTEAANAILPQ